VKLLSPLDGLLGQQWTFHFPNLYCCLATGDSKH
jgi:hypothetical protein